MYAILVFLLLLRNNWFNLFISICAIAFLMYLFYLFIDIVWVSTEISAACSTPYSDTHSTHVCFLHFLISNVIYNTIHPHSLYLWYDIRNSVISHFHHQTALCSKIIHSTYLQILSWILSLQSILHNFSGNLCWFIIRYINNKKIKNK